MTKKRRYSVLLTREITEYVEVVVEASSPREAEQLALKRGDWYELPWERNDDSATSPYLCDPGGVAELLDDQETAIS